MDEPTTSAPRCTEHDGAHAIYQGECYAFGAQVRRPFKASGLSYPCQGCGQRVYSLLPTDRSRQIVMDHETGNQHACPPPLRVELDEERLADGLARAFDRMRDQRRQGPIAASQPHETPSESPPPYPPAPQDRQPLGGIPRFPS